MSCRGSIESLLPRQRFSKYSSNKYLLIFFLFLKIYLTLYPLVMADIWFIRQTLDFFDIYIYYHTYTYTVSVGSNRMTSSVNKWLALQ